MKTPLPAILRPALGVLVLASIVWLQGCCCTPRPAKASASSNYGSWPLAKASDPDVTLTSSNTSGTFSGNNVTVPVGTTIVVSGDLVLSAHTRLQVDGRIEFPSGQATNASITLFCDGNIVVGPTGFIGGGKAGPGDDDCTSPGNGGWHGGVIRLVATVIVNVEGTILGQEGGDGVSQTDSTATGSNGGSGGDVVLSAIEGINVLGTVTGGLGGRAGNATSDTPRHQTATATAGHGDSGGDVVLEHPQHAALPGVSTPVNITGSVTAGAGGTGGTATATGDSYYATAHAGEAAVATGGNAGDGGRIICHGATFASKLPTTGNGGTAGPATATGGSGANSWWSAKNPGGNATATGGNGGKAGIALCPGSFVPTGSNSGGATATATSGSGGSNTGAGYAAASGSATATGGSNGAGTAATPSSSAAAAPTGSTGGAGSTVISAGAP